MIDMDEKRNQSCNQTKTFFVVVSILLVQQYFFLSLTVEYKKIFVCVSNDIFKDRNWEKIEKKKLVWGENRTTVN